MRSPASVSAVLWVALGALLVTGCADPADQPDDAQPPACETSYLTYQTFGAPFLTTWCRGCHASALPLDMRQGSPPQINFDDAEAARSQRARILARSVGEAPTMPPAGGPSAAERALLEEWLRCGAP
ncbi:MAG: hypothetical protein IPI49_07600 [Myxococcales bacterium]|nr:hypothetical protein [Myxococcales bacterium]